MWRACVLSVFLLFTVTLPVSAQVSPEFTGDLVKMCSADAELRQSMNEAPPEVRFRLWAAVMQRSLVTVEGHALLKALVEAPEEARCQQLTAAIIIAGEPIAPDRCTLLCDPGGEAREAIDVERGARLAPEPEVRTFRFSTNDLMSGEGEERGGALPLADRPGRGGPERGGLDTGEGPRTQVKGAKTPRPHAIAKRVEVLGGLDAKVVQRVVRKSHRALAACYSRAKERSPSIEGTVTLKARIGASGRVSVVTVALPRA